MKKVLVHSNFCKSYTGFGKHKKNLLKYLYNTGKYEIVELANTIFDNEKRTEILPWKCIGTLPTDPIVLQRAQADQNRWRQAGYGHETIDQIIQQEKPDIYLGVEDIWAFSGFYSKPWWNKVHCVIHTTLDSLPILPEALSAADHIKHYYVWASFAEREMKKLGHEHVKTVRGIVESDHFFKLENSKRKELRQRFGIDEDFVIGFVFRNQLRKSVPNLLDGFIQFKKKLPKAKAKLLLHTHWSEGWDIPRFIRDKGLTHEEVLTTYFCKQCHGYEIKPYNNQNLQCGICGTQGSCETTNINHGVNEQQLNEIYNMMDVYCHPFTSGGQEIPVQEAKLVELITLVTNYSCGEDCCTESSGGLPLDWSEYCEHGTQFIKASTLPSSIAKQLVKVYNMPPKIREKMGKKARNFVVENFSAKTVGRYFEKLFDSFESVDWSKIRLDFEQRDPNYVPDLSLADKDWLLDLYKNCLRMHIDENDDGYKYWQDQISKGQTRENILAFFHKTAIEENLKNESESLDRVIDKDRPNKRIAYLVPEDETDVIISSGTVSALKETYPDHDIYFFTRRHYFSLVDENEDIYKLCEFRDDMDLDCFNFVGKADKEGLFDLAFFPYKEAKKMADYINHGRTEVTI